MNRLFLLVFITITLASCEKDSDTEETTFNIKGITMENYPKVDGSTSTLPLNMIIACKLLGFNYNWMEALHMNAAWYLSTDMPDTFVDEHIKSSQTHNAFINLIDKGADIVLSARTMSDDEKTYALNAGVTLIETPIALDAFIFIVNLENPVTSLTTKQIQDVYTAEITNWKNVGGNDATISPYVRNPNSGSQELMEYLVMQSLDMPEWAKDLDESMIPGMLPLLLAVRSDVNGLGYTVYYYKEMIVRNNIVKTIAVDGVYPDKNTIKNKTYPYVAPVYAVIRTDLDKNSMAYKLYNLLQSAAGKNVISESGYIPH